MKSPETCRLQVAGDCGGVISPKSVDVKETFSQLNVIHEISILSVRRRCGHRIVGKR